MENNQQQIKLNPNTYLKLKNKLLQILNKYPIDPFIEQKIDIGNMIKYNISTYDIKIKKSNFKGKFEIDNLYNIGCDILYKYLLSHREEIDKDESFTVRERNHLLSSAYHLSFVINILILSNNSFRISFV